MGNPEIHNKPTRRNLPKRIAFAALLLLLLFLLTGCAKRYTLNSMSIYALGKELKGSGMVSATLSVSDSRLKDGTSVELVYSGRTYRGTVHSSFVLWETEPYVFADSSEMYTKILGGGATITLYFNALIDEIWFESVQTYK